MRKVQNYLENIPFFWLFYPRILLIFLRDLVTVSTTSISIWIIWNFFNSYFLDISRQSWRSNKDKNHPNLQRTNSKSTNLLKAKNYILSNTTTTTEWKKNLENLPVTEEIYNKDNEFESFVRDTCNYTLSNFKDKILNDFCAHITNYTFQLMHIHMHIQKPKPKRIGWAEQVTRQYHRKIAWLRGCSCVYTHGILLQI